MKPGLLWFTEDEEYLIIADIGHVYPENEFDEMFERNRFDRRLNFGDFRGWSKITCYGLTAIENAEDLSDIGEPLQERSENVKWCVDLDMPIEFYYGNDTERTLDDDCKSANINDTFLQRSYSAKIDMVNSIIRRKYNGSDSEWTGIAEINEIASWMNIDVDIDNGAPDQLVANKPYVFVDISWDAFNASAFADTRQSINNLSFKFANNASESHRWTVFALLDKHIPPYKGVQLLMDEISALKSGIPAIINMSDDAGKIHSAIGLIFGNLFSICGDKEVLDDVQQKKRSHAKNRMDGSWNIGGKGELGTVAPPEDMCVMDAKYLINHQAYYALRMKYKEKLRSSNNKSLIRQFLRETGMSSELDGTLYLCDSLHRRIPFNFVVGAIPDLAHTYGGAGILGVMVDGILKRVPTDQRLKFHSAISVYLNTVRQLNGNLKIPANSTFERKGEKTNLLQYTARALYFGLACRVLIPNCPLVGCLRLILLLFAESYCVRSEDDAFIFMDRTRFVLTEIETGLRSFDIDININIPKLRNLVTIAFCTLPNFRTSTIFSTVTFESSHQYPKKMIARHSNNKLPGHLSVLRRINREACWVAMMCNARWGANLENCINRRITKDFPFGCPDVLMTPRVDRYGLVVEPKNMSDVTFLPDDLKEKWVRLLTISGFYAAMDDMIDPGEVDNLVEMKWINSFQINQYESSCFYNLMKPTPASHSGCVLGRYYLPSTKEIRWFVIKIIRGLLIHFNGPKTKMRYEDQDFRKKMIQCYYGDIWRVHWDRRSGKMIDDQWSSILNYDVESDYIGMDFVPDYSLAYPALIFHECQIDKDLVAKASSQLRTGFRRSQRLAEKEKAMSGNCFFRGFDAVALEEKCVEDSDILESDDDSDSENDDISEAPSRLGDDALTEVRLHNENTVTFQCNCDHQTTFGVLFPENGYIPRVFDKQFNPATAMRNVSRAFFFENDPTENDDDWDDDLAEDNNDSDDSSVDDDSD